MSGRNVRFLVGSFLMLVLGGATGAAAPDSATRTARSATPPDSTQVRQQLGGIVVPFVGNEGQGDPRVAYSARTLDGTLFVTRDGRLVHSFPGKLKEAKRRALDGREPASTRGPGWTLTETLVGARPRPQDGPASRVQVSRFAGSDPKRWASDVPTFDSVSLGEAWPGITVELAARGRNVEKLFTVAPGADARRISVRMSGAKRLALDADGALIAHTGNGSIAFTAPVAWQDIDGLRRPVAVKYALTGNRYGFRLGAHDPAHAVVIDPLLNYTYLGGTANEFLWGLAQTADGHVYASGYTASSPFPGTSGGQQPAYAGPTSDAFVALFDADLNLIQATYYGGALTDNAYGIAVGTDGTVYIVGWTESTSLPGTAGGAQPAFAGGIDGFVARFAADLKTLLQATYLGATGFDDLRAIALDAGNNVFVAGRTNSTAFPGRAGGAQPTYGGGAIDMVVAKLAPDLRTLVQSTFVGGNAIEQISSGSNFLALNGAGEAYVTGQTGSASFPVTAGAAQMTYAGGNDAFLVKLANDLRTRLAATLVGGGGDDFGHGIAVDAVDNVFLVGETTSTDFPWVGAGSIQPAKGGGTDGFIARFSGSLAAPGLATYLGGDGDDELHSVAINPLTGHAIVVGNSASSDLPLTPEGGSATIESAGRNAGLKAMGAAGNRVAASPTPKFFPFPFAWHSEVDMLEARLFYIAIFGSDEHTDEFWKIVCRLEELQPGTIRDQDRFRCIKAGSSTGGVGTQATANAARSPAAAAAGGKSGPRHKRQLAGAGGYDGIVTEIVAPSYQGLWWRDPAFSESGWGINLAHQGSTIFATWFTYDLAGKPWWLAVVAEQTGPGVYAGDLFTTTGPPFNAEPFDPSTVVETTIGTATFTFSDNDHATFDYTVNVNAPAKLAVTQSKPIIRQEFGTLPRCIWGVYPNLAQLGNYLDLWWRIPAGSESGWGINFTHQGDTIFATWFTYDLAGKPWWLAFVANKTAEGVYTGDVFTTTGPPFNAVPFDPSTVVETTVGTVTLTFTDGNNATFAYTVNGVSQTKQISRQVFAGPGTGCD